MSFRKPILKPGNRSIVSNQERIAVPGFSRSCSTEFIITGASFGTRRRWESDDILEESLAYEPPVPEHLSDDEVLRALQEIPASFREAVLLADVHEFTYKEISDILQIPLGTVMSRISRARRMLRSGLAQFARSLGIQTAREQNQARSSQ